MIDLNNFSTYKEPLIKYDNFGRITEVKQDKFTTQYFYLKKDSNCKLIENVVYKENGIIKDKLRYKYNSNGNILEISENGELIISYKYNEKFWLIREDNKLFNKTFIYEYDMVGNIFRKTEYDYSLKNESELTPSYISNFVYGDVKGCKKLQSFNDEVINYYNGKVAIYRGEKLAWSKNGELNSLGNFASFKYNPSGLRISKTINNITTKYCYKNNNVVLQDNGIEMYFHYGDNGVVAFTLKDKGSAPQYYIYKKNIQGDIVGIYSNSTQIVKYVYDAYGNHKTFVLINDEFVDITSNLKTKTSSITNKYIAVAELNPFRFKGYYYDIETGLYYQNGKYYDPDIGKFIDD